MCGIAGIVGGSQADRVGLLRDSLIALHHRGPDSQGTYSDSLLALGMTRLTIVDAEGGAQPIVSDSGLVIVFNGEVYNHSELRGRLRSAGAKFVGRSDTEVVLRAFEVWGLNAVSEFVGMFAIGLYDSRKALLHLIRDRFGEKPLFLWSDPDSNRFAFSSELRTLWKSGLFEPEMSSQAIHDYLSFRFVPTVECALADVRKIPPACITTINISSGECSDYIYWRHESVSDHANLQLSYDEAVNAFAEHFERSVRGCLISSDVPVGLLLSGGLDSSSIALAATRSGAVNLQSFGVSFEDAPDCDEEEYAQLTARHLGISHRQIYIGKNDFLMEFSKFIRASDEPLADLSTIALSHLLRSVSSELKVVLSGEGADEILGGYNLDSLSRKFLAARAVEFLPKPSIRFISRRLYEIVRNPKSSGDLQLEIRPYITNEWDQELLRREWTSSSCLANRDSRLHDWYSDLNSNHPVGRVLEVYSKDWLVEDLLTKADRASMANSIELRSPFLDHRLTEWVSTIRPEFIVGNAPLFTTKRILRSYAKHHLPKSIVRRPKKGFPVPVYGWLQEPGSQHLLDQVRDSLFLDEFFSKEVRYQTSDMAMKGNSSAQRRIWNLLVLDEWASSLK